MLGAFDPAQLRRSCKRATLEPTARKLPTNMLHAGHCRGKIASAQTLTTPPRSGQLESTKPGQRHSRVRSLRPRREAGAEEQAVS